MRNLDYSLTTTTSIFSCLYSFLLLFILVKLVDCILLFLILFKTQRHAIHTMPLINRVIEPLAFKHVSQMTPTVGTYNLGPD